MKSIAVIGVGTAGIHSLSHLLAYLPNNDDWKVISIYDPKIPILGVGESIGPYVLNSMYYSCGLTPLDHHHLEATPKHGARFVDWRTNPKFFHSIPPESGLHFNNTLLKKYALPRFSQKHKNRFSEIHGTVKDVKDCGEFVEVIVNSEIYKFDFVVDCRGYPEDHTDYVMSENIPVNHCLVHIINEPGTWTYTEHRATKNGWMFGVPLTSRQGWGYLYNDNITSKEEAMNDIAERFNTVSENLKLNEFKFKSYYAKKFINNRIIKNGNRALFFEPIDALAAYFYDRINRNMLEMIVLNKPVDIINEELFLIAQGLERFICFIYHGGSNYESDFWNYTKKTTQDFLNNDYLFQKYLIEIPASDRNKLFGPHLASSWRLWDKEFEYGYFN